MHMAMNLDAPAEIKGQKASYSGLDLPRSRIEDRLKVTTNVVNRSFHQMFTRT